jgi:predicted transcriptional regulator
LDIRSSYYNDYNALLLLKELSDRITYRIIISTIESAKTTYQISEENKLPLSSTYKKIQKLYDTGLISVEKINIDSKGKKVLFYRSRIKSLEFNLNQKGLLLQFNRK